ncbi:MAG TPA: SpoIID/LytB domain-containing protein [Clostridiales bacterium]|nr:SpoIID/LytB domain-containing protein [Clostridiales bacterium]HOL91822.1 SpoIID/LytB domain-containing protein [Clostridiales bacterium]
MAKSIIRKITALLAASAVFAVIFSANAGTGLASNTNEETIRVGLYYKGSSVDTAQSIFDVSAQAGVRAGFVNSGGTFTEVCSFTGSSAVYVRKDAYYHTSGTSLKEFSGSGSNITGKKYGPYHVKIGTDYPDAASAMNSVHSYRQAGIDAYIAYNDAWQVWTGFCMDTAEAEAMIRELKSLFWETGFEIVTPSSNRVVVTDGQYQTLCVFGSKQYFLQLRPATGADSAVINIKGKPYRGCVEVKRLSNSDMTVINVVSLREYLYGNVPPEIGGKSPSEALKAQAVVSKMYALNNRGKHGSSGFDICATTHCQVYKGYSVEVAECRKAIDEVYDKIITYNGKPIEHVYYFASGGGSTEDVRNVWGSSYPYLVSVKDDYEKIYTWSKTLRASDIKSMLPELGSILGVTITRTAPTGRVTQLAVTGSSRGEPLYFSNERCRTLFGLDSQLYTITTDADVYLAGLSEIPVMQSADSTAGKDGAQDVNVIAKEEIPASGPDMESGTGTQDPRGGTDGQAGTNGGNQDKDETEISTPEAGKNGETAEKVTSLPVVAAPVASEPIKTQLGGKKVVTAGGITTISGSNNKITILGADGAVNKAAVIPETYTFTGKGWGHAVGMSQEGAIGMAKAGKTYEEILTYYFQGTKVE